MKKLSLIFMGTPDFAVPSLQALAEAGHDILAVVTQPDRPKGRGKKLAFSPVKEKALELGLPIIQVPKVKDSAFIQEVKRLQPEMICVVAFGQILPEELLAIPKYGCINVHGSLLPAYRGAAPLQRAVLNGDPKSGITTMLMDVGLDTGDMLLKEEVEIGPEMSYGQLHDLLAEKGANLLTKTVTLWAEGGITPTPQEHELATYAAMLDREDERINWDNEATKIHNQVRGLAPQPGAYTFFRGQTLKIKGSSVYDKDGKGTCAGEIIKLLKGTGFIVQCGQGSLLVTEVQPMGKKAMSADSFINGYHLKVGEILSKEG